MPLILSSQLAPLQVARISPASDSLTSHGPAFDEILGRRPFSTPLQPLFLTGCIAARHCRVVAQCCRGEGAHDDDQGPAVHRACEEAAGTGAAAAPLRRGVGQGFGYGRQVSCCYAFAGIPLRQSYSSVCKAQSEPKRRQLPE